MFDLCLSSDCPFDQAPHSPAPVAPSLMYPAQSLINAYHCEGVLSRATELCASMLHVFGCRLSIRTYQKTSRVVLDGLFNLFLSTAALGAGILIKLPTRALLYACDTSIKRMAYQPSHGLVWSKLCSGPT